MAFEVNNNMVLEDKPDYYKFFKVKVQLVPFEHRGKHQIGFKSNKYSEVIPIVKKMGALYTKTHRLYYLENTHVNLNSIMQAFKGKAWVDLELLKRKKVEKALNNEKPHYSHLMGETQKKLLAEYVDYIYSRGFSESTIGTYKNLVAQFLGFFANTDVSEINVDMVQKFLHEEVVLRGYSKSYQKQMVSAIKSFYSDRLSTKLILEKLPTVQKERKLPKVLSVGQVKKILENTGNLKHKTMLALMYGCGLRISELLKLRLEDVNTDRMVLEILNAKGFKDRQVPITLKLVKLLRDYYKAYRPTFYMFEGQKFGTQYSARSVNMVLKSSARKAGINKNVHAHMLRHSFATHLLETGVDTRYIQKLLGHKSSKTTEIYTFVSREKLERLPNPYDQLGI